MLIADAVTVGTSEVGVEVEFEDSVGEDVIDALDDVEDIGEADNVEVGNDDEVADRAVV